MITGLLRFSVPATDGTKQDQIKYFPMDDEVAEKLVRFLLDRGTGNVVLHINEGVLMPTMNINETVRGKVSS